MSLDRPTKLKMMNLENHLNNLNHKLGVVDKKLTNAFIRHHNNLLNKRKPSLRRSTRIRRKPNRLLF